MRRVLVALVILLVGVVPAAEAAKPSVTFKRKTLTRSEVRGFQRSCRRAHRTCATG